MLYLDLSLTASILLWGYVALMWKFLHSVFLTPLYAKSGLAESIANRPKPTPEPPRPSPPLFWCKILGVDKDATLAQIQKAFRRLAQMYHPDIPTNRGGNVAKFAELTQAYDAAREHCKARAHA